MKKRRFSVFLLPSMIALIAIIGFLLAACRDPVDSEGSSPSGLTLSGTVSISGNAVVGQTLTANTSNLNGNGQYRYQWQRDGYAIGYDSSYYVRSEDIGYRITVMVTCDGYSNSVMSNPIGPVTDSGLPALTGTVSISGIAQVGQTLTANTDNLNGSGTISYQWKRHGTGGSTSTSGVTTNIGTDSYTYVVQAADVGSTITVTVTRTGYSSGVTSNPTATVITVNQNPVTDDFEISNLTQTFGSVIPVMITPKPGKSTGPITIFYNGSTALPTAAGTYTVTFNVTAATGWNVATGLAGGTLTVISPSGIVIGLAMNEWELTDQAARVIAHDNKVFTVPETYDTYRWYLDGTQVGTASSYTFNKPVGVYQLLVVVTNSSGESRSGHCWITVDSSLAANIWVNGGITDANDENWYSFPVSSGTTYYIWWNSLYYSNGDGTKSGNIDVSARYADSSSWIFDSAIYDYVYGGWTTPQSFTATQTGTVEIRVMNGRYGYSTGTYGIVYSASSTRPSL